MKMGTRQLWLLAIATFACTSCVSRPTPSNQRAELQRVSEAYNRSSSTASADSIAAYFAPDIVVMSPQGDAPVHGLEENRTRFDHLFHMQNPSHTMTTDSVVVSQSGDLGYTLGKWTVGVDTPGGRLESAGDYLAVWERRDGAWKIVAMSAYPFS
jgi:ketosteroid isomerase-like protein